MAADRTRLAARPPSARSAVSNATARGCGARALLPGVDGRSALARRFRDLCEALAADLGEELTEADMLTVRSAAALAVHGEELQARIVRGEPVDPDEAVRVANAGARLLAALRRGRQRRARPTGASLHSYLAERAKAPEAAT